MKKRLLSMLLVMVMLLGMLPSVEAAREAPLAAIEIDFMAFAKEAAEQPWWDDLRDTDVDGIKVVGTHGIRDEFTAAEAAAYTQMLSYLDENENWTIDEDFTDLNKSYYGKSFFINAAQTDDYGVRLFTNSLNDPDYASKIAFTIYAPEAGTYALNMSVLNEAITSEVHEVKNPAAASGTAGGGTVDLYINDALVADNHKFANDVDCVETVAFGAVQLKKGENRLMFHFVGDRNGNISTYRRSVNLRSMEFAPVGGIEVGQYEAKAFDPVALGHLPYGTVLTEDIQVVSSDENVFTASVSGGKLLIEGVTPGKGTVSIEGLCEIEVRVKAFDGTWDDLRQDSIFIDFKSFAKRASMESWWNELAQVSVQNGSEARRIGNYYYKTMSDSEHAAYKQMKAWLSENADWRFNSPHWDVNHMAGDRMYISADDSVDWGICLNSFYIGMGEDSTYSIAVQAPKAGLYNLKMDIVRQNLGENDALADTSFAAGGAYIDVYVGDTLIAENYATRGDGSVNDSFGAVYLNEGENIISMEIVGNVNGNNSVDAPIVYCGRANVGLRSMELTPLTYMQVDEGTQKSMDLRTCFLPTDQNVTEDYTAKSADETVVVASVEENRLVLEGVGEGLTKVVLSNEQGTVAEFFVCVTEPIQEISKGDTITVSQDGWYETALTYEKTTTENIARVYLGEYDLGAVRTQSDKKLTDTDPLRPVYLQAGTYEIKVESEKSFVWKALALTACDEPALNLCINPAAEKQYRKVELPILGYYENGRGDSLQNANWSVQVSDDSVLTAEVIPATETSAPILQVRGLQPTDDAWVEVTAELCGIEGTVTVPVTVLEPAGLVSADISIPCVEQGQIARLTTQTFQFDMIGSDGLAIYPDEVEVTYEVSNEDVIVLDRENHSFYAAQDGEATVRVSVRQGSFTYEETFDLTVAQEGENRLDHETSTFSGGTFGAWYGFAEPGDASAMTWTEIADDGTGNYAMKVTINPDMTINQAGAKGTNWMLSDGYLGSLMPGHIYEMSFQIKAEDLVVPEGSRFHLQLRPQFADKVENSRSAATIGEMSEVIYITLDNFADGWTTVTMPVRAPVGGTKMFYGLPELNLSCHYNSVNGDGNLTGYSGTIWIDDFKLREVGVGSVGLTLKTPMETIGTDSIVYVKPLTTNGNVICPDAGLLEGNVTIASTNEDVVRVKTEMEVVLQQDYGPSNIDYYYPSYKAYLVGLNADAQLVASYTIAGHTAYGALDISASGLPDQIRDLTYTLDGFRSIVVEKNTKAHGAISGLTTQLTELSEATLRENGTVYFASSNDKIVKVDAVTGDVTAMAEGTAVVTAYANLDGVTASSKVTVTVTDDTDLVAMQITSNVDYVGVGSALQLYAEGSKASGSAADMSLYPVAWSVSDETIAAISTDGRLLGLKEGLVTVTAQIGVMRKAVTATKTIKIVENGELAPANVQMDFADGRSYDWSWYTLENNGMQINRERTYEGGKILTYNSSRGLQLKDTPVGSGISIDFHVPRDGWYYLDIFEASFYDGAICDLILDDHYMGIMDCVDGTFQLSFGEQELCNSVYLEAGTHTIDVLANQSGQIYLGRLHLRQSSDPHAMELTADIGETELVAGERTAVTAEVMGKNGKQQKLYICNEVPEFTNYCLLKTSDPNVVTVSGMTITAKAPGQAVVTLVCEADHEKLTREFTVTVEEGVIAHAELTAENTTVKPEAEPFALTLKAFGANGEEIGEIAGEVSFASEDETIASVSSDGIVTLTCKEGSVYLTARITEGGRMVEAGLWITVTQGKTEPTLYTYEERANAQENVMKYAWAWSEKESVVRKADLYVENVSVIYDLWLREGFPRATRAKLEGDPGYGHCAYCGEYLIEKYGVYPYIVDPINNPWKITCPICKRDFPSNDFGAYYESGLDERGYFHEDRADKSLLVNELYPEMGEGWGVDDGWGYETGKMCAENGMPETYIYIAYYIHNLFDGYHMDSKNSMVQILDELGKAYMYTGDEKYGSAGAILLDRVAEIYPEYDLCQYDIMSYNHSDGNGGRGKFVGSIWEADIITTTLANAADIFWPAMDNPDVVEFLRGKAAFKGMSPEDITPEYIRGNVDQNILLEIREVAETMHAFGNFGMVQNAVTRAAVALDRLPETAEMIEWVNRAEKVGGVHHNSTNYGGGVLDALAAEVDRDGFSDEVSIQYNGLWTDELIDIAEALSGYTRVQGVDLWQNQKFINMFTARTRISVCGDKAPQIGETGTVQYAWTVSVSEGMIKAFIGSGDRAIAQAIYAANGNSVEGIHADIFTKDPESGIRSKIQQIVNEDGEYNQSESNMMAGFGVAILREGPARYIKGVNDDEFSDYWMFFGKTGGGGHARFDSLHIDIDFRGLTLSSAMGYPLVVSGGDPERQQWVRNTISHNTVVVDRSGQVEQVFGSFPLHFEDAGKAGIMDADASNAYPETDIYRRTVVTVKAPGGEDYAVDFFRILGGSEHVYSFHGVSQVDPATTGLELIDQPMGTYAGADIPFGAYADYDGKLTSDNDLGSGFSWLDEVSRDADPDTTFTVDWAIEDYAKRLPTSSGIHMKLTMLSEEPLSEVALANGYPPRKAANPEHIEYLLVKNSGEEGLDTLFTTVIEPYQHENYIASAQLVSMKLTEGSEGVTDKAAAIKVTLKTGRVDYIIYATNPDCAYEVDGKFRFQGFAGVVSYEGGQIVYAWGSEADTVADVIEEAKPAVTGKVLDYTRDLCLEGYTMTVELDQPATEAELTGRYIYVNNDLDRNAAYRIYGAEVSGNTAVLDLKTQTLTRKYLDPYDLSKGFIHNIEVGQTYTIPLSASFDVTQLFTYTPDQVIKAGSKLSLTVGTGKATYEADGQPSGMKLDTRTGLLTWTTSKTQTGRYPITVKAIDAEGDVIATMSFTIYVVSYSGSSYTTDVCTHAKAVTYNITEDDGSVTVETVCPACGTITKNNGTEEEANKFVITGSNMTLGNELVMNFMVKSEYVKDGYYAVVAHNGVETVVDLEVYNTTYCAASYKLAAKQLADELTVVIRNASGNAVSEVYTGSAKAYAMKALTGGSSTAKFKTLVVDMLNYGAAAQTYFGYNTASLANADLTASQQALATKSVACENNQVKGKNCVGANLTLEDRILLNLMFKGTDTTGMYAEISYTDYRGNAKTYTVDAEDFGSYGTYIKITVDQIVLADAFCDVTVKLYNADNTLYGTATDSVESYVARSGNSALSEAIIKFAYSAREYLS